MSKVVHLTENSEAYGDSETWCGAEFVKTDRDPKVVTCSECLGYAVRHGKESEARLVELAATCDETPTGDMNTVQEDRL